MYMLLYRVQCAVAVFDLVVCYLLSWRKLHFCSAKVIQK